MKRIDVDYFVIAGLLSCGLYVFCTGLVTDLLGLHQFAFHRFAGYGCAALIGLHLLLNWERIKAYLGWRLGSWSILKHREEGNPRPIKLTRRDFLFAAVSAAGGYTLGRFIPGNSTPSPELESSDLGALYHRWSSVGYAGILKWGGQPGRYKTYPEAERFPLPPPGGYRGLSVEEALDKRRSVRAYSGQPLSQEEFSRLLHAAQGITEPRRQYRAAPSAGALYPIELYPVVHNVSGLEPGVYHYAVREHELELVRSGDFRTEIMGAGLWQEFMGTANVCFVLTAIFQRTRWKYKNRTYRYVAFEAGHIGQNLYLSATSMGLGACAVGAFHDEDLNTLLEIDGEEEESLYVITVGKTR
jgi:SagB-type dehydrogenase family enzyme